MLASLIVFAVLSGGPPARLDGLEKSALLARSRAVAEAHKADDDAGRRARIRSALFDEALDYVDDLFPEDRVFLGEAADEASKPFDGPKVPPKTWIEAIVRGQRVRLLGYVDPAQPGFVQWQISDQTPELQAFLSR